MTTQTELNTIKSSLLPIIDEAKSRARNLGLGLLKYIAIGTGTGKTHVSLTMLKDIMKASSGPSGSACSGRVVGIYIAPLRAQLKHSLLRDPDVTYFEYYGRDAFKEDWFIEIIRNAMPGIQTLNNALHLPQAQAQNANNPKFQQYKADFLQKYQSLGFTLKEISDKELNLIFFKSDPKALKEIDEDLKKLKGKFVNLIEGIGELIIRTGLTYHNSLSLEIVGYTFPFQIAYERSCIITMTSKKFTFDSSVFVDDGKDGLVKRTLPTVNLIGLKPKNFNISADNSDIAEAMRPIRQSDENPFVKLNTRFEILIDEVEAVYKDFLESLQSQVIPDVLVPQSIESFSRISSESFLPPSVINAGRGRVYKTLARQRSGVLQFFRDQTIDPDDVAHPELKTLQVAAWASATGLDSETLGLVYDEISDGYPVNALLHYAALYTKTSDLLAQIGESYERFYAFLEIFSSVRALKIKAKDYKTSGSYLQNIFAENHLSMIAIEELKKLTILPRRGKSGFVNVVSGEPKSGQLSLYDYVVFYTIVIELLNSSESAAVHIGDIEVEDSQDQILKRITAVRDYIRAESIALSSDPSSKLIDSKYVYLSVKNIFKFPRQSRYSGPQRQINPSSYIEAGLALDQLTASPEEFLKALLSGTVNVVLLLSATALVRRNYVSSFHVAYLEKEDGNFYLFETEDPKITALNKALNEKRLALREVAIEEIDYKKEHTRADLNQFLSAAYEVCQGTGYALNPHKKAEIKGVLFEILAMLDSGGPSTVLYGAQKITNIEKAVKLLTEQHFSGISAKLKAKEHGIHYELTIDGKTVRLVFYRSKVELNKCLRKGEYESFFTLEPREKLILITAYSSANRGLNFVTTDRVTGEQKDFEVVTLSLAPYYSALESPPGQRNEADFKRIYTYMKYLIEHNRLKTFKDFIASSNSDHEFAKFISFAHDMLRALEIIQMIGRGERRDFTGQRSIIKLTKESLDTLEKFFDQMAVEEPGLLDRLSTLNTVVYRYIAGKKTFFVDAKERDSFKDEQWDRAVDFREFITRKIEELRRLNNGGKDRGIIGEWGQGIRNLKAFNDPKTYLESLEKSPGIHRGEIDSLYLPKTEGEHLPGLYIVEEDYRDPSPIIILSDYKDALSRKKNVQKYDGKSWLAVDFLRAADNPLVSEIMKGTGIDWKNLFRGYIPRPHFVVNILKGYLGELVLASYVKKILTPPYFSSVEVFTDNHMEKYPFLFEKADMYLKVGTTLIAIDAKHMGRITANRKYDETSVEDSMFPAKYDYIKNIRESMEIQKIIYVYSGVYSVGGHAYQRLNSPILHTELHVFNIFYRTEDGIEVSDALSRIIKDALYV